MNNFSVSAETPHGGSYFSRFDKDMSEKIMEDEERSRSGVELLKDLQVE